MNRLSKKISMYMLKNDIIQQDKYDWCVYVINKKLSFIVNWIFILVIGSAIYNLWNIIIISYAIMSMRKRTGGYHANNSISCCIISCFVSIFVIYIAYNFLNISKIITVTVYISSVFIIMRFAPVNHPNMHFTQNEFEANKKEVKKLVIIFSIIIFILFIAKNNYMYIFISSMFIVSMSIIVSKLLKQEIKPY